MLRRVGKIPYPFLFLLFFHACLKPKQPCDSRGASGNRDREAPELWGREPPARKRELLSREAAGAPFASSLSLCTHLVWEVSLAPGSKLRSRSFPARGLKGQGWKIPGRW